jgi:tetratricopeptide (TPR) repeat protein
MRSRISSIVLVLLTLFLVGLTGTVMADLSTQFKQAETFQKNGQYEQAETIYQQIVTNFPDTNEALVAQRQLTIIYIATDRQQQADAAFEKLIADFFEHKGIAEAVWLIAKRYNTSKKYDKSIELYQYNVEHFPKDIHAMWSQMNIIRYYISDGNEPAADASFNKLLTVFSDQPTLPEEVWRLGKMYSELERNDKAFELYQYNVEHFPKDIHAMWSQMDIIRAYINDGNEPAADVAFSKLLTVFSNQPTLPEEVWRLGKMYSRFKRDDRAFELYQYNIEHSPKDIHAMWSQMNIIRSYISDGNEPAADAAFNKLLAIFSGQPKLPDEVHRLAELYDRTGRYNKADMLYQKAIQLYQYVIDSHPDSNDLMWAKAGAARSNIALGNEAAAEAVVNELIADFNDEPNLPQAIFVIGEQYYYKAFEDPNKCLKVKSEEFLNKAKDIWQRITTELPHSSSDSMAHAYYFSAVCYRQLGNYEKAAGCFQKVVDDWPNFQYAWSAQSLIGECYENLRDTGKLSAAEAEPEIERAYQAVIEKYPGCSLVGHACLKIAQSSVNKGKWIDAATYFELFLQKSPDDPRCLGVLYDLGQVYEKIGGLEPSAAEVYSIFIEVADPNDPRVRIVKARIENLKETEK